MGLAISSAAIGVMFWFSTAIFLSASQCNPQRAPEMLAVAIENPGSTALRDYPVAVAFDQTSFTFRPWEKEGSEFGAWDPRTRRPLPYWLESYDPKAGKGLLWVKLASLPALQTVHIWITSGRIPRCSVQPGSGYEVFPFFSDVHDLRNWRGEPSLSLTDDIIQGPLRAEDRQVIESDGTYNSTPSVVRAANGDWVLSYLKGSGHVNSHMVVLRRSEDQGQTWSPEAVYFDTSKPDPGLARTPDDELFISFVKLDPNGNAGAAFSRSTDNGLTWGPFAFFDHPVNNTAAFSALFATADHTMYGVGYGPSTADPALDNPTFWFSTDDGETWTKRSDLSQAGEPGLNETNIIRTGPDDLLAIARADDNIDTFGRRSDDMGASWGKLISYTVHLGTIQDPQLIRAHGALILLGRQALGIPGAPQDIGFPRQLVAYVSYDQGRTFRYGTVLDTYTGQTIDGAYCWPLRMADGRIFVVYYADSHNLRKPDIKSLILRVDFPRARESGALHLVTELAASQATRALHFGLRRYSLDFRFRSQPTPAGSQFSVGLSSASDDGPADLVRWELPSTHAADPTSISGFIAGGQFVPLLNSFAYGQEYRVRTIVDETQATQEPQVLNLFGQVTAELPAQPFAQGTTLHPNVLAIGNNSTFRATDTLIDFVFIRPVADVEPVVTLDGSR